MKKMLMVGMAALLVLAGCDTGTGGGGSDGGTNITNTGGNTGVPADLVGTWRGVASNGSLTFTFTRTTVTAVSTLTTSTLQPGNATGSVSTWTAKANTEQQATTYPSGYKITGTITTINGLLPGYTAGQKLEVYFYLNAGKTALITPLFYYLDTGVYVPLYKQ